MPLGPDQGGPGEECKVVNQPGPDQCGGKSAAALAEDAGQASIRQGVQDLGKVKVAVMFRGREITLSEQAGVILKRIVEELGDTATVEQEAKFEGRTMVMILSPK